MLGHRNSWRWWCIGIFISAKHGHDSLPISKAAVKVNVGKIINTV